MTWFKRDKKRIESPVPPEERRVRTEGLWIKCDACRAIVWKKDLEANWNVCPKCQHHFRLGAKRRLELLLDARWHEHDAHLVSTDPLEFVDTKAYIARLTRGSMIEVLHTNYVRTARAKGLPERRIAGEGAADSAPGGRDGEPDPCNGGQIRRRGSQ